MRALTSLVAVLATAMVAQASPVVYAINETSTPSLGIYWLASDVGWFYTPNQTYYLDGINTEFGATSSQIVTAVVYTDRPVNGGTLLASGTFTPVGNTFTGATFSPIQLISGQTYFFGFQNVTNLFVNVTSDPGATALTGLYYDYSGAMFGSGPEMLFTNQPIVQFTGLASPVPEPMSIVLFGSMMLTGGLVVRWKKLPPA